MNIPSWPDTVAEFREMFAERFTRKQPETLRGAGPNFVTNDFLGYVLVGNEPCEITTGTMQPLAGRVFGVTFGLVDDRNGCFDTLTEVYEHLYGEAP